MSNFGTEEKIAKLEGKIRMYEKHAIHRKIGEAKAEIERLKADMKAEEAKEVKLSDVKDLAPKPETARKEATTKTTKPVARATPAKSKSIVGDEAKDKT